MKNEKEYNEFLKNELKGDLDLIEKKHKKMRP